MLYLSNNKGVDKMKQFMFLIIWIVTSMLMPLTAKSKILIDYNTGSIHTDKYISQFKDYDLYIVRDNSKYFYDGTVLTTGIGFTNGGFLNLYEFNASKDKSNDTYLFTGSKYWTMTNATEGKYTIDPTTESKYKGYAESEFFGVRITQYTQDEVEVSGTGEYFNPWVFIPISRNHTVTIRTATKTLKEQTVNHGSNTNIDVALEDVETAEGAIVTCYYINSTKSIEYTSSSLSSGSTLRVTINNIKHDVDCVAEVPVKSYTVTATAIGGTVYPANRTVVHGQSTTFTLTPLTNYTLTGATVSGCTGATISGDTLTVPNVISPSTCTVTLPMTTFTVTFNANGGSVSQTSKSVTKGLTYGPLPTPTRNCYSFGGWYTATSGGTQVLASTTVTLTSNQTLYAIWTSNPNSGTLSYTHTSCSSCTSYGTYTYSCGGSYSGSNSSYNANCLNTGSVSYTATCGYGYTNYSCGGSIYTYFGECITRPSCSHTFSPTSLVYNLSGQLTSWSTYGYNSPAGYISVYAYGFKNGQTCSCSSTYCAYGTNIGGCTNCGVVDVTSSKTGSGYIGVQVSNSAGSNSCGQSYSWR